MSQTNKPVKVIAVLFAGVLLATPMIAGNLKIKNLPTRLTASSVPEAWNEIPRGTDLGFVGDTTDKSYPEPPVEMWKTPRQLVEHRATARGYNSKELKCLFEIIDRESDWNPKADNPHSTAFGLFQRLELDPNASIQKQVRTGLDYVQSRYGTACEALKHHDRKGWY